MTRPLLTLLALILLLPACAGDDGAVDLQLGDAFSFTPAVDTTAAYFTITNEGDVDDVLLRADADGFGSVELHDTVIQGGAASMAEQEEGIAIPAGETVTLEPGAHADGHEPRRHGHGRRRGAHGHGDRGHVDRGVKLTPRRRYACRR